MTEETVTLSEIEEKAIEECVEQERDPACCEGCGGDDNLRLFDVDNDDENGGTTFGYFCEECARESDCVVTDDGFPGWIWGSIEG